MIEAFFSLVTGVWLLCKFIWILCNCDKIKGKKIKGIIHYDKYEYEYKGKKRNEYAWVPFFNKTLGKEYSIWVHKVRHTKIYSKNEVLLDVTMGGACTFVSIGLFLKCFGVW